MSLIVLQLAVASAAQAESFYYYGKNNTTCWQTGTPVSPSEECDSAGAYFLNGNNPVRTLDGALSGNLTLTKSGDYCNAYDLHGGALFTRDEVNEGGLTGFSPPTPYGAYQMDDQHGDTCQALGAQWGQLLRPTAENGHCTGFEREPCGMQHYVSFASQNGSLRPWSSAFNEPILVVEGASYPKTVNVPGGAWAYLCPLFEQVGSAHGLIFEYCFVEWEDTGYVNYRGLVNQVVDSAPANGHTMNELITAFQLGTSFSTEIAGSGNTYTYGEHPWIGPFKAGITKGNLEAAINAANTKYGTGFSNNPAEYALIGVEQGVEGANINELGARTENLQLRTEYGTLNPFEAKTTAATGIQQTQATLNGSIRAGGFNTTYHFEYGPTSSYGTSVPAPDGNAGSGANLVLESSLVSGLKPGTTYHYRIVATNARGTIKGVDTTFTTHNVPFSLPGTLAAVSMADQSGNIDVFGRLSNGDLGYIWRANGLWNGPVDIPTSASSKLVGDPSAVVTNTNQVAVFWKGADGNLWLDTSSALGLMGTPTSLGMGTLGGPPKAIGQSNGTIDIFWKGGDSQMYHAWGSVGGWAGPQPLGGSLASDPSPVLTSGGKYAVFWKGTDGNLWLGHYDGPGTQWSGPQNLGMGTLGGPPKAIGQSNGTIDIFWKGGDSQMYHAWGSVGGWAGPQPLGGSLASDPSPVVTGVGNYAVFWKGADGNLWDGAYNAGSWSGPQNLGSGILGAPPVATSPQDGTINVFWGGTSPNGIWSDWFTPASGWQGPVNFGG